MQLTIIIINWNTLKMLNACLKSVYENTHRDTVEVIVVDNASEDGSQEMVTREFPQTLLIRNTENRGFAAANNQALEVATGKYVLLLNSDTVVHDTVLQCSVDYMEKNDEVGVMGCRVLNTDGTLQPTCSQFPTLLNLVLLTSGLWKFKSPKFFDRFQMRNWERKDEREVDVIAGCYMLVRSEAIKQVGLLDESFFFFGEETDWCKRFQYAGWKLRFSPVGHITHHGGGSVNKLNYKRDLMLSSAIIKLHLKHGGRIPALTAWFIVFSFSLSRAIFWTLRSAVTRNRIELNRRNHFLNLVLKNCHMWPKERTYRF